MPVRRLAAVFAAIVLAASLSGVALAESGPDFSGLILLRHEAQLSPEGKGLAPAHTRLRLNVSGETSRGVAYYGRVQATGVGTIGSGSVHTGVTLTPPATWVFLAQARYELAGLASLTVGRQAIAWTVLDEFTSGFPNESAAVRPGVDAVMLELPLSPVTLHVAHVFTGHDTLFPEETLLHAQVPLPTQGVKATLGALVAGSRFRPNTAYGVNGAVGLGPVTAYFEVGNEGATNADYQFVGVKLDALKQAVGVDSLVEYDLKNSHLFARVGRELLPGLTASLRYKAPKGQDAELVLRTEVSLPF